jgi:hypothetical protein
MNDHSETVSIHGRIFQKVSVDERIYCVPVANDDIEEDRLTAQHDVLFRLLGSALVSNTIPLRDPSKVLDCGYGGGDWCVQFAEEFEDCEVRLPVTRCWNAPVFHLPLSKLEADRSR